MSVGCKRLLVVMVTCVFCATIYMGSQSFLDQHQPAMSSPVLKRLAKLPSRHQATEEFRMARDILSGPHVRPHNPGEIPSTAYYVWCGDKPFTFGDYLGILSIVKILEPLRIFFYYNKLPSTTEGFFYHSWFPELKQSLANLVFWEIEKPISCDTPDAMELALELMLSSQAGGVYVGERVVLTHIPDTWKTGKYFTYINHSSKTKNEPMLVFIRQGVDRKHERNQLKNFVLNQSQECHTSEQLELMGSEKSPCVVLSGRLNPKNIINNTASFSAFLRWLYYGRTDALYAKQSQDPQDMVPLINHMIYINPNPGSPVTWPFERYLSVLSALYVAGFHRVYVHGDTEPSGELWDKLKKENVTFVYIDQPYAVFQQEVNVMEHKSDILRIQILYKYGGAYNDNDVIWVKPLSEEQRKYPSIACYEWSEDEVWPGKINSGLIVSKPKALFLIKVLESFWCVATKAYAILPGTQILYGPMGI
ncbi:uncharacterized protein LOC131937390 isoform X2 [Physella acuta]|uniref:uncharacterized protein LOC131937390 isoform X2 n=1 Tax=Physella acuta TaxID=109671 RepID=UPI0027DB8857|nr:uncharacterized protein LOC131937390 isoform X2 [Physella acuta]